ncbi:MAG: hypothetical protein PHO37_06660 [Kiritimatiellae bacterium]|nr:hypothetical protein [Kiritimatiellia bacterium]
MSAVKQFIKRVRQEARRKPGVVTFRVFGEERLFWGYDLGSDTFIFEKGLWSSSINHAPILIIKKSELSVGAHGYIFTLTSGNHSVALVPLVSGAFWNIGAADVESRHNLITRCFVYANVVKGKVALSQREAESAKVVEADAWLQSLGFRVDEVFFSDRNSATLEIYRRQGQEWRVKPLAWNSKEMLTALNFSRAIINSKLKYYHSSYGVHFLPYAEFQRLLKLVDSDYAALVAVLKELVFVYQGQRRSNMRTVKINAHHEIELFGLKIGAAERFIIPELEDLLALVLQNKSATKEIKVKLYEVADTFKQLLEHPELADESSDEFIETMYLHLSGAIYQIHSSSVSTAFDARRTALPGATFRGNRPDFHVGADQRTKELIENLGQLLSNDEQVEYANVYELRENTSTASGAAGTREIVYKTNRRPLLTSMIEKRLARHTPGYGNYVLARVQAFKALGINLGEYRLLTRLDNKGGRKVNYFLRNRCPGEPLGYIKPRRLSSGGLITGDRSIDSDVAAAIASLLGNAAAQNLIMKKYLSATKSCRFGEGKEIFDKGYNVTTGKEMPKSVMICSMRGTFGWPDTAMTEKNMRAAFDFYLSSFTAVLYRFWQACESSISLSKCADHFFTGFECKTKEVYWDYMVNKEAFDMFDPHLHVRYGFSKKWKFALWALEQQHREIDELRTQFLAKIMELLR